MKVADLRQRQRPVAMQASRSHLAEALVGAALA